MNKKKNIFGQELILDLFGCDLTTISSKEKLIEYSDKLCSVIKMKKFGEPFCKKFGLSKDFTAGYSLVQLIETSNISGHFSDFWKSAYINIFSCKTFNSQKAIDFTKKFFKPAKIKSRVLIR